jgi:hypothetical protein
MMNNERRLISGALMFVAWLGAATFALAEDTGRFTTICDCVYTNAPCEGEYRWAVKTETNQPPSRGISRTRITTTTPTAMGHWADLPPLPDGHYKSDAPRSTTKEKTWYEVTGRVTLIRAEPDGDLHIQLQNAAGTNGSVNVVVEVPAGHPWCDERGKAFTLTSEQPPLNAPNILTLKTNAVIRVVGRAFFDGVHAVRGHQPNRRRDHGIDRNVTIWEIHPVMTLELVN